MAFIPTWKLIKLLLQISVTLIYNNSLSFLLPYRFTNHSLVSFILILVYFCGRYMIFVVPYSFIACRNAWSLWNGTEMVDMVGLPIQLQTITKVICMNDFGFSWGENPARTDSTLCTGWLTWLAIFFYIFGTIVIFKTHWIANFLNFSIKNACIFRVIYV